MTLRHLRIFIKVYQNNSISLAAEQLYFSQPAVSLAIKELESSYHTKLFDRLNRKLFPTIQGDQLYPYAVHIISSFDEINEIMQAGNDAAPLRVGTSITIGNFLLPDLIVEYSRLYPHVHLKSSILNSLLIEQKLLNNELDVGLVEGMPESPAIDSYVFMEDRICFFCPPDHPLLSCPGLSLEVLLSYPVLLRETGSAGRSRLELLAENYGLTMRVVMESASTQAIVRAVAKGLGIAALPRLLITSDLASGAICELPVDLPQLNRSYYMITHKNKYLSKNALSFINLVKHSSRLI